MALEEDVDSMNECLTRMLRDVQKHSQRPDLRNAVLRGPSTMLRHVLTICLRDDPCILTTRASKPKPSVLNSGSGAWES